MTIDWFGKWRRVSSARTPWYCACSAYNRLGSGDWEQMTYTRGYHVAAADPDTLWELADDLYHEENTGDTSGATNWRFDEEHRDTLVEGTINALRGYGNEIPGNEIDGYWSVRGAHPADVRDRMKEIYAKAPSLTQTQATTWALHELGLTQVNISTLQNKSQSTVSDHLHRAATNFEQARKTAELVARMEGSSKPLDAAKQDVEDDIAQKFFHLNKKLVAEPVRCPNCGTDAGEWEGDCNTGDWVNTPTEFYLGNYSIEEGINAEYNGHVQCPKCKTIGTHVAFRAEWKDKHGKRPVNLSEYDIPGVQ